MMQGCSRDDLIQGGVKTASVCLISPLMSHDTCELAMRVASPPLNVRQFILSRAFLLTCVGLQRLSLV